MLLECKYCLRALLHVKWLLFSHNFVILRSLRSSRLTEFHTEIRVEIAIYRKVLTNLHGCTLTFKHFSVDIPQDSPEFHFPSLPLKRFHVLPNCNLPRHQEGHGPPNGNVSYEETIMAPQSPVLDYGPHPKVQLWILPSPVPRVVKNWSLNYQRNIFP